MRIRHHRCATVTTVIGTAAALFFALPSGLAVASIRLDRAIELRLPLNSERHGFRGLLDAMDCVRPGYCTAGGVYGDTHKVAIPMVATESVGHWARAIGLRMPADAAASPFDVVTSVQCAAIGSCVAAGYYYVNNSSIASDAFVASQTRGHWAPAHDIAAPKDGYDPGILTMSCFAPRSCVAAGSYLRRGGTDYYPMEVTELNGRWLPARALRLPAARDLGAISSVSCPRRGFCAAVGNLDGSESSPVFAVTESNGRWHRAFEVRLPKGTGDSANDDLTSISCTAPGSCTAAGFYDNARRNASLPMTVTDSGGTWARARSVNVLPGNDSGGNDALFVSISCPQAGSCVALGRYTTKSGDEGLMISVESGGKWQSSREIPPPPNGSAGSLVDNFFLPEYGAIDCPSTRYCAAGTIYQVGPRGIDPMTVAARLR